MPRDTALNKVFIVDILLQTNCSYLQMINRQKLNNWNKLFYHLLSSYRTKSRAQFLLFFLAAPWFYLHLLTYVLYLITVFCSYCFAFALLFVANVVITFFFPVAFFLVLYLNSRSFKFFFLF